MATALAFIDARRAQHSVLAAAEKRTLLWLAARMPRRVSSDHLTGLGFAAMIAAGVAYALSAEHRALLHVVNLALVVNWFGDSLDGTLARYRQRLRPRYGFYVDHIVDTLSAACLIGGMALGGYMTPIVALGFLVVYYALSINIYLATYTLGTFQISFFGLGPTELRIAVAIGNLFLMRDPYATILGQRALGADIGALVAMAGMLAMLFWSIARNTVALYRLERLEP
jgi:phosphatidylglycerophosphate synthase